MVETVTLNPAMDRTLWVEKMRLDGSLDGRIVHQVFAASVGGDRGGVDDDVTLARMPQRRVGGVVNRRKSWYGKSVPSVRR